MSLWMIDEEEIQIRKHSSGENPDFTVRTMIVCLLNSGSRCLGSRRTAGAG
jgi:hypothetical protein